MDVTNDWLLHYVTKKSYVARHDRMEKISWRVSSWETKEKETENQIGKDSNRRLWQKTDRCIEVLWGKQCSEGSMLRLRRPRRRPKLRLRAIELSWLDLFYYDYYFLILINDLKF